MGWFTKTVEVEKIVEVERIVEKVVLGAPSSVTIYEARTEKEQFSGWGSYIKKEHHGYYLSCADAFEAWPGKQVKERRGVCVDGMYFVLPDGVEPIEVSKTKRPKGRVSK